MQLWPCTEKMYEPYPICSKSIPITNIMRLTVLILVLTPFVIVNCESNSTTPATPVSLPFSMSVPITSASPSTLFNDRSYIIPLRLKLLKENNLTSSKSLKLPSLSSSTPSESSLIPKETKSNTFRWLPFSKLLSRQGRQAFNVQIAVTITLAITAALSAIILALLIALLISIGSLGYAVKKCSFGFGKYLYKLYSSFDEHGSKFISTIHLITRILNEVLGRQNHQTDFLFHLVHIIREIGIERHNRRLISSHEINYNDINLPHNSHPDLPDSLKSFDRHHSSHHHDPQPPKGFFFNHKDFAFPSKKFKFNSKGSDFSRNFGHSLRSFNHNPFGFINQTSEYEFPNDNHHNHNGAPNLQYSNPFFNNIETSGQMSDSSSYYDHDRHPNHRYD